MRQAATVITGASSGIGAEFAHLFAQENTNVVVLVARRRDRLDELALILRQQYSADVRTLDIDLSVADAAQRVIDQLDAQGLFVDTLINNAGFGLNGEFAEQSPQQLQQMMQLNILTLTELTRLVVPSMRRSRRGRILNVASIVAFQPCPRFAVYAASKAYVLSFSEALHAELGSDGIHVTALCPGSTETEFHQIAQNEHARLQRVPKDRAADVAKAAYAALNRNERSIVTGWINKPIPLMTRLTPKPVLLWAAQRMAQAL
jgi:uncharacterized protein